MKSEILSIKPIFYKETQVNSEFSSKNFIKKGYKILPKLTLKICEKTPSEENNSNKSKFLKVFKKAKFIQKFEMKSLYLKNEDSYLPTLSYIAKKMSKITSLSFHDFRKCKNQYKGLMVSWLKGKKYLKSLRVSIWLEDPGHARFDVKNLPEKIIFPTNCLKYAGKLEEIEIVPPMSLLPSYMNDLWRFENWPKSIKKLSILNLRQNGENISCSSSLVCMKNLKSLEVTVYPNNSMGIMKPLYEFLSHPNCQIEALALLFQFDFEIDTSVCNAIKQLTRLKKIKLQFSLLKYPDNFQVLKSLEDHSLKDLSLDIKVRNEEEVILVTEFLSKKKKDIEKLKLRIKKEGSAFRSLLPLEGLLKTIDDFPNLSCLSLSFSCYTIVRIENSFITEENIVFNKLFSKPIPFRKFKIFLQDPFISDEGFFALLEALKTSCPALEKLQIIIGRDLICDEDGINSLIEAIMGLKNLRSIRFINLSFESGECFFEFIKAIYSLNYLRNLVLGTFSEKIGASAFVEGVKKILLKPGLRKFKCRESWAFRKILDVYEDTDEDVDEDSDADEDEDKDKIKDISTDFCRISLTEVKKKNPYLIKAPLLPIFELYDYDHDYF